MVAVGGDGTVNELVNGVLEHGPGPELPMLAVVPGGSTNVFSRALGRSRDPVEATAEILDSLRSGHTRLISLGTATPTATTDASARRWFVFAAGLGFDAEVIERVDAGARPDVAPPALSTQRGDQGLPARPRPRHPAMTVHVPGRPPAAACSSAWSRTSARTPILGHRAVNPSPEASFDTGLEVFALGRMGRCG